MHGYKIRSSCHTRRTLLSLVIAGIASGTATVQAQNSSKLMLEEVVVTAQKREQSLQDVPLAVSAISGDTMREAGVTDMSGVAQQMPSLQVVPSTSPATASYRIRGVGNIGNIPTFEPAVGVFQDGAYRSRPLFSASEFFDIERIEVLRGPQSTLYGKNTTAGVVAVYTRAPAQEFEGNAEFTVGNLEGANDAMLYRFIGGVSGALSDTLAGSLGISTVNQDHTSESAMSGSNRDANNIDRQTIRGQLEWVPTDALSIRLIAGATQQEDDTYQSDLFIAPGSQAETAQNVLVAFDPLSQSCSSNDPLDFKHCSRVPSTTDLRSNEATVIVNYALENEWTVTSVSSWDWFRIKADQDDVAQLGTPVLKLHDTQEAESWQQELRLASAGGETVDWLVGGFAYYNAFDRGDHGDRFTFLEDVDSAGPVPSLLLQQLFGTPFPVPFAAPGQNGIYEAKQNTKYFGVFGQSTWNVTEKFAITGGLRWQTEEKDASVSQSVTVPGLSLISANLLPAGPATNGDQTRSTDEVTWSISPQYFITEDITVYATAARGYKSGGFNIGWGVTPLDEREFKDERVMSYEAGVKASLFDSRMTMALSAFYTEFDNYQDAAFISQQFSVGNADKVELKGAELEGEILLSEHFSANFAVSYADLTYDSYDEGLCYPGRTPDGVNGGCILVGEQPVNAPEWTTHIGLVYETTVPWGDVYARADWNWSDEYNTSFSADPRLVQDSYSWVNMRVGTMVDDFEFVAWVENLTNEDVRNQDAQLNLFANDPSYQTFRQPPRSFGLTARYQF